MTTSATNVGKGGSSYPTVWNNVIYTDPNVGKEDLWILPGVQHTDVWNNASNKPHNVMTISDQRPLCAIVGNCLCILNAFTHFLYLGGGLYVTIKKWCKGPVIIYQLGAGQF